MQQPLDSVYVTYWSLLDPLCQSQSLPYLRKLAAEGYRLGLITFEQPRWAMSAEQRIATQNALLAEGIQWRPVRYHKSPPVLSTLFDIGVGALLTASMARRSSAAVIHGRSSVPGAIASIAARLAHTRLFIDADGPLSEEYVDGQVWKEGSLPHRMTAWGERRAMKMADVVAVLTEHRKREVEGLIPATPLHVLPCAVDTERFRRSEDSRAVLRRELGLSGTVLVYVGKTGGWYDTPEMLEFVEVASRELGEVSFLVLTGNDPGPFAELGRHAGIPVVVRSVAPEQVPAYLSAADVGLCFLRKIRTGSSCSPIKIGEYLACGLPVVISDGCGDYDELFRQESVGVVLSQRDAEGFRQAAIDLKRLLSVDQIGARCRDVARRFVGLNEVVAPRYSEIYAALAGRSRP